ncbi:MAG TPA: hypothetical protein P5055_12275, partial [Candidatus Paceibacterota bacterium]|nr:hypothetical protein [Candidatus Paceibacterota bacterium]
GILCMSMIEAVQGGSWAGKAAVMAVFGLLIVVLLCMPAHMTGKADGAPRWWSNVRLWAIGIALVQILVYAWWG